MKTSLKIVVAAAVVLMVLFSLGGIAGASSSPISSDEEYMVVFHPGITWQEAASEVASWGNSWKLAAVSSSAEERYVEKMFGGLKGELWIGGQKASGKWQWESGES